MISAFIIDMIREYENELDLPQEERYTDTDFFYMEMQQADAILRQLKTKIAEEQHYADQMLMIQSIISKF
tara:strand:+ start:311 stop:520 length:210 start_codon:yes stop_codon:yes gene_type:complete